MGCEQILKDKIALVTGGSRGIGRAICLKLASLGARVFINYANNEAAARTVMDEITRSGGRASLLPFDVSDRGAASDSIKRLISDAGALHILVNNAGIARDNLAVRMKQEDWDSVISINLTGAFNCIQSALTAMMKQRWGRIVNIGSVVGTMGNAGQANYAAAKAGLEGLTRSIALEVASRGITANVVSPGFIDTDMTAGLSDKIREQLLAHIPMGRMGRVEDVAEAVAFLSSDGASYITGHVLHVNGGLFCD
ncbi:3-oxoacyl-[acyl-carrier-protein] reductase [Dissulfurimicrobium hydrothermale]|uniref:3-oxoacyl-[acyl-carrier-protein] reductase n=2 Tax=Dissulfurimicrobium TaxID=1769732 RepID=UPI001EDAC26D|nr:3-oxoacyl-[acyl-carrier-protein] reductase [Dissulfurimicrobium hydrothermale]UKL14566.1 3-oxoacyl-[acyl-carrier-protein] reductase [Dissulfurimicrobium hydrothermale]